MGDSTGEEKIASYSYANQILSTDEMGIKVGDDWDTITTDFSGLMSYMKLLLIGGGAAQKNCKGEQSCNKPLGDRVIIKTIGKCKAMIVPPPPPPAECASRDEEKCTDECKWDNTCISNPSYVAPPQGPVETIVSRSILINNIPDGSIPFIPGTKGSFPQGLIPGILKNMDQLNPLPIFKSFTEGSTPSCTSVDLRIINNNGSDTTQTAYISDAEIKDIDACTFAKPAGGVQKNPLTNDVCNDASAFTMRNPLNNEPINLPDMSNISEIPDDPIIKLYYISVGMLMLYILTKYMHKVKRK